MNILERFQKNSSFDSEGEFSIDESKAKIKMATFQLATKQEFIMLVAAALVLAGTDCIEITQEPTQLRVIAKNLSLDSEALSEIDSFLLDSSPDNRPYNLLAVACNYITPSCRQAPQLKLSKTTLYLTIDFNLPFFDLRDLILERLKYLPCKLVYNETDLPTQNLNNETIFNLSWEDESNLTLVHHGVIMPKHSIDAAIAYEAVVPVDHLSLDASFSELIKDDNYKKIILELDEKAAKALCLLAKAHDGSEPNNSRLLSYLQKDLSSPVKEALQNCALFPLADKQRFASLDELIKAKDTYNNKLPVSAKRFKQELNFIVVLRENALVSKVLNHFFLSSTLTDAEDEYRKQLQIEERKRIWQNSARKTELPPGRYLASEKIVGKDWEAALGYLSSPQGSNRIDILFQGKLLTNEPLDDVAPGGVAVLNVFEGEVDSTWSHLEGRAYRSILKVIKEKFTGLFGKLDSISREDLSSDLENYLIEQLQKNLPCPAAYQTPLFKTTIANEFLSIAEIEQLPRIAIGDPVELPADTGSDLIPKPLILYNPTTEQILYSRLGKSKVEDIRYLQQRLVKIAKDLKNPRKAQLDRNDTELITIDTIECPLGKGELGLTTRLGSTINLSLMLEGGFTENTKVKASTIFQVDAIISTAKLSPNSDWSGFIRDSCFKELIDILKDKAALIEQNLLVDEKAPIEMRLRLLEAYPLPDSVIKELPIFATAKIGQFTTLAQIEKEWQKHGILIQSKLSIGLEDRLILQPPEKQLMPLLEKQLGNIKWVQESEVIKTESSRKSFYLKPALSEIKLGLVKCLLRTKFNEGEGDTCGEIGIVDLDHEIDSGYVDCYVDHRHICRDHNLISRPFVAAIASPYLKPNEYFTSVETAAEVKRQLEKHRSALMLAAANSGKKRLNDIAWSYFSSKSSKSEERKKFIETQSLQIVDGSTKTVKELQDIKIRGYATIRFSWYNTNDGVVLLLEPEKVKQVSTILGKRLSDLSDTLENELKQHEYLLQLPTKIDQALKPKLFSASKISAEIAFAPDRFGPDISGFIVGLNSNGQTIGQLPPPLYPVVAVVKGIKSSKKKQANAIHQAVIQGQERTILNSWIEEVCLDWIEHLANPRLSKHQEILLDLLLKTMRNIGSTGSVPAAMAEKLWNLPLFERVDGTRVSGLALDAAIISSKKPIVLAEIRAASPGSAILMKEKSRAYKILASRFGDDCLQWADRPMLLDPKKMAKSIWKFINSDIHLPNIYFSFIDDSFKYLADYLNKEVKLFAKPKAASNPSNTSPQVRMIDDLQSDIKNVIGRNLFSKADGLFLELGFGRWPLGPAMYPKGKNGSFRLNLLHSGIRWLASNDKDDRQGRVALTLLAILWVAMVNDRSKQFTDEHEGLFLERLGERLIDIYGAEAKKS